MNMLCHNLKEAFLNQFILKVPYNNEQIILFNRTNGAIFLLKEFEYDTIVSKNICDEELYNNITESGIISFNNIVLDTDCDNFLLTIELSTICNFKCTYCYQNCFEYRPVITQQILDNIYLYIENIFISDEHIRNLIVGFIGGEPMLHIDTVYNIIKKIDNLCTKYKREVSYHIDTNGSIDFSELFNFHNNIEVSVSLSLEKDHLTNRPFPGGNSFEICTSNLKKLSNSKNRLSIRYNTNHLNIHNFEEFVLYVKNNLPQVYNIDPMYTDNYDYNLFLNKLSISEFSSWNSSKAIDILIKYNFPITGSISSQLKLCSAYQPYSCKIYADGYITLCDSMFHQKDLHISALSRNPPLLNKSFKQYKTYNPTYDTECSKCYKLVQCHGKQFCRKNICEYTRRYEEELFISRYVYYCEKGLAYHFVNM